jgi:tRNA G26 N,N-dimethylase Trm1
MITAKEARVESNKTIEKQLEVIEGKIKAAVKLGKYQIEANIPVLQVSFLVEKLQDFGYKVTTSYQEVANDEQTDTTMMVLKIIW